MVMHSCLYVGRVRHRRFVPVGHAFTYRLFLLYLDLDELHTVFRGRWLWSVRRPTLACFRRSDHLGDPNTPIGDAVRDLVESRTGQRPNGPIRLLTHLRYFGYGFNPVSFYYCFDEEDTRVETIVAEVNNTPWGEQHCYVLKDAVGGRPGGARRYQMNKEFHVSPFMPMEIEYDWRFSEPAERLAVHMINSHKGRKVFDATLGLEKLPIRASTLAAVLAKYPFMTAKVIGAIYYQALRLWIKRVPFHAHPNDREAPNPVESK
jgi:DUF1365 family protein